MPNTLTAVIPTLYEAMRIVSRELVGFIPSVARDSNVERAALNQIVSFHKVPAMLAGNIAAAATGPDPDGVAIGSDTMSITKSRGVSFYWTGEEQVATGHSGQRENVLRDQFAQAMRTLCNEIEGDVAGLYLATARAIGTAGTAPFASTLDDAALVRKILDDNGTPMEDRHLVVSTRTGVNIRKLTQLTKANEAGGDAQLRRGVLLDLFGLGIRESAATKIHTAGTGTSVATAGAENTIGQTVIQMAAFTAGIYLPGDVLTISGHSYVAQAVDATANTITISEPGLRTNVANGTAVTRAINYEANVAFHRSALQLATRVPAMPEGGDAADDVVEVQDPHSGLGFQVALYRQRRRIAYEVGIAWGVKGVQPEHAALLIG